MAKRENDLGRDPVGKLLLRLAIPTVTAQLVNALYNIVDRIYIGHIPEVGDLALTGLGVCFPVILFVSAISALVGMGGSSRAVVHMGEGKMELANSILGSCTTLLVVLGAAAMAAFLVFQEPMLYLFGATEETIGYAMDYLTIYLYGSIFVEISLGLNYFITAQGFSTMGMATVLIGAVINIVLDPVFIFGFGMGVKGAALATITAQGVSAVLSFFLLMRKLKGYEEEEKYGCYDFGMMRSMVKIAVPSTLQQSIVHMGILLVQSVVNSFGSAALAGYSAGSRIESLSIVPMLAMGNAMSTFTAQNIGAGKLDRVKEGYKMCYVTVLTVGAGLCIMYQLFGGAFVSMFLESGGSTAYSVGVSYVKFLSFFYAFIGLKATTDGLLRGAGDVAAFTAANLVNLSIRVIVTNVFAPVYGIQVAWMAVPMGWAANYIISFGWYLTGKWKRVKVISADQGEKRKN